MEAYRAAFGDPDTNASNAPQVPVVPIRTATPLPQQVTAQHAAQARDQAAEIARKYGAK